MVRPVRARRRPALGVEESVSTFFTIMIILCSMGLGAVLVIAGLLATGRLGL